jgi:hypothetical protein
MALGIYMCIRPASSLEPVHAHINLVGFARHRIFGVAGRAFPGLATDKLAKMQFSTFVAGALLLMIGIALSIWAQIEIAVIVGSILLLIGALVFAVMALRISADRVASR